MKKHRKEAELQITEIKLQLSQLKAILIDRTICEYQGGGAISEAIDDECDGDNLNWSNSRDKDEDNWNNDQ